MTRTKLCLAALAALLVSANAASAQNGTTTPTATTTAAPAESVTRLLAYDDARPADVRVVGTERTDGVVVEDVTFAAASGGAPVAAYVVRPAEGAGPFAGVLFVHWFAPPEPTSNRTQYLAEAKALARRGTVSLLPATFWSEAARYRARRWQDDYQNTLSQARDLRRALDVLVSRPGVDPGRIAYVGHDYGAMFGALVAGADPRPKAYVLIAGAARFPDWYLYGSATGRPEGEALENFRRQFAPLDPASALSGSKAAFFFQYGERDRFTPRENFVSLYMAAPSDKRIATYASDHDMAAPVILHDRTVWLAEQLGLRP